MPLVRIDLAKGRDERARNAISEVVYTAMTETLNVPKADRFQVIVEHPDGGLVIDQGYLGIARTKDAIIIQITLNEGRTVAQKQAFYKAVADGLNARVGLRREDVMITLVEVKKENWSFGNGEAQYVT